MSESVTITVAGIPAPGGSKRAFVVAGRAVVTDDCRRNAPWREAVGYAARAQYQGEPLVGPLMVTATFTMPWRKGDRRKDGSVKPNAPLYHTVKPDATKLWRAVEDALTGILWHDDASIANQLVAKVYGAQPGVIVRVSRIESATPA